jgi:hypothetical protein
MGLMSEKISVNLPRGVASEYFIATFGFGEGYFDQNGLIDEMSNNFQGHHPAYRSQWNIKQFNKARLTLEDVLVSKIAYIVHEATKLYLTKLVENGFDQESDKENILRSSGV